MHRLAAFSLVALFASLPAVAQQDGPRRPDGRVDGTLTGSTGAPPSDCILRDPRPACDIAAVQGSLARNRAPSPGTTIHGGTAPAQGGLGSQGANSMTGTTPLSGSSGSTDGSGAPVILPEAQSAARDRLESRTRQDPLGAAEERDRQAPARSGGGLDRVDRGATSTTGTESGTTRGLSGSTLGASGGASGSSATPGGGRPAGGGARSSGGSSR